MITSSSIREIVSNYLDGSERFIVEIQVKPGNSILVLVDSYKGITIDECADISRFIESNLDRNAEDFQLEVSSPGLTQPFKVVQQYLKYIGTEVEVLLKDGKKIKGKLLSASQESFTVESFQKVKSTDKSKNEKQLIQHHFTLAEVKSTKVVINF